MLGAEFIKLDSIKKYLIIALPAIIRICNKEVSADKIEAMKEEIETLRDSLSTEYGYNMDDFISKESLGYIEWAGGQYYIRNEYEIARAIYIFLCYLNPKKERYWIACGMTLEEEHLYLQAINFFDAAALINPTNPFPSLYAAECYTRLFDKTSAREKINSAKVMLDKNQKLHLEEIIDEVETNLRLDNPGEKSEEIS